MHNYLTDGKYGTEINNSLGDFIEASQGSILVPFLCIVICDLFLFIEENNVTS